MKSDWNWQLFGNVFLDSLWQGLLVALLLKALLMIIPERRGDVRYLAAFAALIAFAAWVGLGVIETELLIPTQVAVSSPSEVGASTSAGIATLLIPRESGSSLLSPSLNQFLFLLWIAGMLVSLLRIARGLLNTSHIVRKSVSLPSAKLNRSRNIQFELFGKFPVQILCAKGLASPIQVGWLRPTVIFPTAMLTGMPPSHFDAILLHELAHFRRGDYFFHLIQSILEAVLFFHPAVWWISAQIDTERERACDDRAAKWLGSRHSYASALGWIEQTRIESTPGMLSLRADGTSVVDRVRRLARLHYSIPPTSQPWKGWLLLSSLSVAAAASSLARPANGIHRETSCYFHATSSEGCVSTTVVNISRNLLERPVIWKDIVVNSKSVPLLRSVILLEKDGQIFDPQSVDTPVFNEFPNQWVIEHDLDFLDSSLPLKDKDNDGFNNLEEYDSKTDPTKPDSHPPYVQKVNYTAHKVWNYPITYAALPSDKKCQLNRAASQKFGPRDSSFLRAGDISEDGKLRILSISPQEVVAEFIPLKKEFVLPKKTPVLIPIRFAELHLTVGNSEKFTVRVGETFRLPEEPEVEYLLKSADENECVITDGEAEHRKTSQP